MNKPCEACDGSGQITFFQGASRFLMSWEECPVCGGLGSIPEQNEEKKREREEEAPDETST